MLALAHAAAVEGDRHDSRPIAARSDRRAEPALLEERLIPPPETLDRHAKVRTARVARVDDASGLPVLGALHVIDEQAWAPVLPPVCSEVET